MRNFLITVLLLIIIVGIGWELIGVIPLNFIKENPEPEIREFIIKRWIDNMKTIHPHCEGAYINFFESNTEEDLIEIYGKCYRWRI